MHDYKDEKARARIRNEAFERLRSDSDRAAGIVSATFVEEELELCLRRHFHSSKSLDKHARRLFRPTGQLGAFGTKIDLACLVGIYDEYIRNQLDFVKDIRNKFAHRMDISSFEHNEVGKLCAHLDYCDKYLHKYVHAMHSASSGTDADTYTFVNVAVRYTINPVTGEWVSGQFDITTDKPIINDDTVRQAIRSLPRDRYIFTCMALVVDLMNIATTGRVHQPSLLSYS